MFSLALTFHWNHSSLHFAQGLRVSLGHVDNLDPLWSFLEYVQTSKLRGICAYQCLIQQSPFPILPVKVLAICQSTACLYLNYNFRLAVMFIFPVYLPLRLLLFVTPRDMWFFMFYSIIKSVYFSRKL